MWPGCSVAAVTCLTDGVCIDDGDADDVGICFPGCTDIDDCRSGYVCAGSPQICQPGCTGDGDCDDRRCDTDSGFCRDDDANGNVGDPCTGDGECTELADATCLLEASGFTGGYCSQACDPYDADTCETGSVCNTDGDGAGGDFCQKTCITDLDCRSSYVCEDLIGAGGPVATCVPD